MREKKEESPRPGPSQTANQQLEDIPEEEKNKEADDNDATVDGKNIERFVC